MKKKQKETTGLLDRLTLLNLFTYVASTSEISLSSVVHMTVSPDHKFSNIGV
ncbi:hypothetical protein SLEP1_g52051 [Rubroshorea leprosula]|uniref:Uncharacterized protein n=1 Tax=Rubroshorea leprosula TaxID=152421 RepID=A0AAV5M8H4_9ROSI|nr:hypothetical protein SLEP1_g52051 [Rubroshorea leprosula]